MRPIVEGQGLAFTTVTGMTWDKSKDPIVFITQTEPDGRVVQYQCKVLKATLLREPLAPLRIIKQEPDVPESDVPNDVPESEHEVPQGSRTRASQGGASAASAASDWIET